jgi:hypothetical protein
MTIGRFAHSKMMWVGSIKVEVCHCRQGEKLWVIEQAGLGANGLARKEQGRCEINEAAV